MSNCGRRFSWPVLAGVVFPVLACAGLVRPASGESGPADPGHLARPRSLDDLKAVEAQAVRTAGRVFPGVVGVNNSAGVIVSKEGLVVTAAHLGGLRRDSVTVRMNDGKTLQGKTLGMFGQRDAAMVKIDGDGPFPLVELGSTKGLQKGAWCLLFGHMQPRVPGRPAVLRLARVVEVTADKVVTDCTVSAGDSGGPLFDLDGRLVGVNSFAFPNRMWHVPVETYKDNWQRLLRGDRWGGSPRIVQTFNLGQGARFQPAPAGADRAEELVRPLAERSAASVVRVFCDGKAACLGTVLTEDGLIATKASELGETLTCRLHDGRELKAQRVRTIDRHDLALLRVAAEGLVPVPWAEPGQLAIGRWVVVPGAAGELLGVGVVGVQKLAVPLQIREFGLQFGPDTAAAATVKAVTPRSPAAQAGLKPGDLVVAIDGQPTPAVRDVLGRLAGRPAEKEVTLRVRRGRELLEKQLRLSSPAEQRPAPRLVQGAPGVVIVSPRLSGSPASKRQEGFPEVFQHDVQIRPSDCGSPLVGLDGKVLGINIARISGRAAYGLPAHVIRTEIAKQSEAEQHAP